MPPILPSRRPCLLRQWPFRARRRRIASVVRMFLPRDAILRAVFSGGYPLPPGCPRSCGGLEVDGVDSAPDGSAPIVLRQGDGSQAAPGLEPCS